MNSFIWKNPANAVGNITKLEQEVQKLQTQLQQIATQIQQITTDLANKAGKAEENHFTKKQKITSRDQALTIVQNNNAAYISFETNQNVSRGYVGMGSSNSNKMQLNGKDGVQITSAAGDLELNPAGNVNAFFKEIINVRESNQPNAAITKNTLFNSIKHHLKLGQNIVNGIAVVQLPTPTLGIFSWLIKQTGSNTLLNEFVDRVLITNGNTEVTITFRNSQLNGQAHIDIWYLEA